MSAKHPIISVTGSSGAGTTSVRRTFEHIFRREEIGAAFIEGDAFHRFDRDEMRHVMNEEEQRGNSHFSHFGPTANLLEELEAVFRTYAETGQAKTRHYVHDAIEADLYRRQRRASSRIGGRCRKNPKCFSMKGCTARSSPTR